MSGATAIWFVFLSSFAGGGERVGLRWTPKAGEKALYEASLEIKGAGDTVAVTGLVERKVSKSRPDGYTVVAKSQGGFVTVGTDSARDERTTTKTIAYGPRGDVRSVSGGAQEGRQAAMAAFVSPEAPVEVGGTWAYESPAREGWPACRTTFTLVALQDGQATVGGEAVETGVPVPMAMKATWVLDASGSLVRLDARFADFLGQRGASATLAMQRR
ncbi:MAG: hypothetical protein KIT11_07105 [Fimbriimonadaceae bacterium]|nr:hypothetical protein [Fimbriimonadaceae bacterium]QYK56119.1 MAG: hypothetical protein KF733_01295 [Fimbriimonadaceae bacterium]